MCQRLCSASITFAAPSRTRVSSRMMRSARSAGRGRFDMVLLPAVAEGRCLRLSGRPTRHVRGSDFATGSSSNHSDVLWPTENHTGKSGMATVNLSSCLRRDSRVHISLNQPAGNLVRAL